MTKLKITQTRSTIDRHFTQKRTIIALGLGRIRRTVMHDDTPQIRGMIRAVEHLVEWEEVAQ
jgi:large subunit ribosomal protein L30